MLLITKKEMMVVVVVVLTATANAIYYKRMKNWAENESPSMNYDTDLMKVSVVIIPFL